MLPVSSAQRWGTLRLPSAARRARSRRGSTSETSTLLRAWARVTSGMNVRARPSAMASRPAALVPSACTPIQYTPGAPEMLSEDRGTRIVNGTC